MSSGGGSNLKLFKRIKEIDNSLNFNIVGLISDRECGATKFAKMSNIKNWTIDNFEETELDKVISKINFDICFTGIYKILTPRILNLYGDKLRNVHYSLLPKYAGTIGMEATKLALKNGDTMVGATSHFLTSKVDSGPIINQALVFSETSINLESLVFKAGFILHFNLIEKNINLTNFRETDKFVDPNGEINFKKPIRSIDLFKSEDFWKIN